MADEIQTFTFEGHYRESDGGNRCDIERAYTREQAMALAAIQMLADEADALIEHGDADRLKVGRGEVQETDARLGQQSLVVAILAAQVDHRGNAMRLRQLFGLLAREAPADRQPLCDPVELRLPGAAAHFRPPSISR